MLLTKESEVRKTGELIKGLDDIKSEDIILICFPHAGGSASFYNSWKDYLGERIKICPIQLPGREDRFTEEPIRTMDIITEQVVQSLMNKQNKLILFGHSMGTKMLYEVERELESRGRVSELIVVSACSPPHVPDKFPISDLPDDQFIEELIKYNGIPESMALHREIIDLFLPMLRSDFVMSESYICSERIKLACPILALGGNKDDGANEEDVKAWAEYTDDIFQYHIFEGDHFYLKEKEEKVIKAIKDIAIERCV